MRIPSGAAFLASKLEAFHDRGAGDVYGSHDLEDVLTLIDGRAELAAEVAASPRSVETFVRSALGSLLAHPSFLNALPGHVFQGAATEGRVAIVLDRIRRIAALPR